MVKFIRNVLLMVCSFELSLKVVMMRMFLRIINNVSRMYMMVVNIIFILLCGKVGEIFGVRMEVGIWVVEVGLLFILLLIICCLICVFVDC